MYYLLEVHYRNPFTYQPKYVDYDNTLFEYTDVLEMCKILIGLASVQCVIIHPA